MVLEVLHVHHCATCNEVHSVNTTGGNWKHRTVVPLPENTQKASGRADFDLHQFGSSIFAVRDRGQSTEMFFYKPTDESVQNAARNEHEQHCPGKAPGFKKMKPYDPSTAGVEHNSISSSRKTQEFMKGIQLRSSM